MTEEQAHALVQRIQSEAPLVETSLDASRAQQDGHGYRVKLLLRPGQRTMSVTRVHEWKSIKLAWQWFLLPEEAVDVVFRERRGPEQRHLVDGIPMYIFRRKDGYWVGCYTANKQAYKKYFGKVDPRSRYPLCERQEAVS